MNGSFSLIGFKIYAVRARFFCRFNKRFNSVILYRIVAVNKKNELSLDMLQPLVRFS